MKKKVLTAEEEKDIKLKRKVMKCSLCKEPFYRYLLSPMRSKTCYKCHDKFADVFPDKKEF